MHSGFVASAVLGSHGVMMEPPRCRVPARPAFAGASVPRRVRPTAARGWTTVTAVAASCAEVSEETFEAEVLQSVRGRGGYCSPARRGSRLNRLPSLHAPNFADAKSALLFLVIWALLLLRRTSLC
jgi:hypothetical protein